ncbi:MAG: hypothetical protein R3346_02465 [Candidatus Spechtbacterales bacterium]|nr:hypothetical protein [Candidatus Spechtbacterales bacterium]
MDPEKYKAKKNEPEIYSPKEDKLISLKQKGGIEDLLERGSWYNVDSRINSDNFSGKDEKIEGLEFSVLRFREMIDAESVLADMELQGLEPGTLEELLLVEVQAPDFERQWPVVALGSVFHDKERDIDLVPVAYYTENGRGIRLTNKDSAFGDEYRFLAIKLKK